MFNERKDDSSVLISISAGRSSKHLVRLSKPPILTLQILIFSVSKFETLIGENGIRLSGGEKQRISIARAMLKKSSIILLDEATSSLDSDTETKIQEAIKLLTNNKTTLVIAHRLSTIKNSKKIYVIEKDSTLAKDLKKKFLDI